MSTPLASKPLVEALLAMLQAAVPSACDIYWAGAPQGAAPPYAVLYPDAGMESIEDRSLNDDVPNDLRFQVTSVGASADQAQWVADKTSNAILTGVPTVTGRRVRPTRQESSQPVRRDDESTGLWLHTAQYLTRSERI